MVSQLLLPTTIKSVIPELSVKIFQTMFNTHTEEQVISNRCVVNVLEGTAKHMKQGYIET
jgi:hypothetical protein